MGSVVESVKRMLARFQELKNLLNPDEVQFKSCQDPFRSYGFKGSWGLRKYNLGKARLNPSDPSWITPPHEPTQRLFCSEKWSWFLSTAKPWRKNKDAGRPQNPKRDATFWAHTWKFPDYNWNCLFAAVFGRFSYKWKIWTLQLAISKNEFGVLFGLQLKCFCLQWESACKHPPKAPKHRVLWAASPPWHPSRKGCLSPWCVMNLRWTGEVTRQWQPFLFQNQAEELEMMKPYHNNSPSFLFSKHPQFP